MSDEPVDILLVDDNAAEVELTLHAFHQCGHEKHIHVARNGAEALEFLTRTGKHANRSKGSGPKLVVLDLKLPLVDGHYVLRQIRSNPETKNIPVVILTSSREKRDVFRGYQMGVNSYIVKPVSFDEFVETAGAIVKYWLSLNHPPF